MGRPKKEVKPNEELEKALKDINNSSILSNPIDKANQDDFLRKLEETRLSHIPKMKIALVREKAIFEKANEFAAGYDVKAFNMTIEDGYIKFMLGIKSELPIGWYAEVVHRSSNSQFNSILANTKGTIDCDFRGEWQARLKLLPQPQVYPTGVVGDGEIVIQNSIATLYQRLWKEGEIALQVLFHKIPDHQVVFVDQTELTDTQRGGGGFGSTTR